MFLCIELDLILVILFRLLLFVHLISSLLFKYIFFTLFLFKLDVEMALRKFADIPVDELSVDQVKNYINYGQLFKKDHESSGKVGAYYDVFCDVADKHGNVLKGFFFCSICESVLKKNPSKGTQPMNRHADACRQGDYFIYSSSR